MALPLSLPSYDRRARGRWMAVEQLACSRLRSGVTEHDPHHGVYWMSAFVIHLPVIG